MVLSYVIIKVNNKDRKKYSTETKKVKDQFWPDNRSEKSFKKMVLK